MSGPKLTKAQTNLLARISREAVSCRPTRGSSAVVLYLAGYAAWDDQAGGGNYWLTITPEGRAALNASKGE